MELNLQSLAPACFITGEPFAAGERVASYLARDPKTGAIQRYDVRADAAGEFAPPGDMVCRWVQLFKPRNPGDDAQKLMKLTAENLFLTLADPATEPTEENIRLLQFLALMMERKKIVRPRGVTPDGLRTILEHSKTKQRFEVPIGEMDPAFFNKIHAQLGGLFGGTG